MTQAVSLCSSQMHPRKLGQEIPHSSLTHSASEEGSVRNWYYALSSAGQIHHVVRGW